MSKNILVINSGSSSIRFQLLNVATEEAIIKGHAEELSSPTACITFKYNGQKTIEKMPNADSTDVMKRIFDELDAHNLKDTIKAVGHRVVNGGESIKSSVIIDDKVLAAIEQATDYAPLHHPAQIKGIRAVQAVMPDLPQVAVFDTAFHSTMPERAYRYAVPTGWYRDHGVRRYGAHGTSYRFVLRTSVERLNLKLEDSALIIAHLGNGASLAAVLNGESVDTTMGFTPLEGLVMGTRSGSIDPAIIIFMKKKLGKSAEEILDILNKESGLLGLSNGLSNDLRELWTAVDNGNKDAKLAIEVQAFQVAKHIAAMMVSLPRVDAIVFTGGAGEKDHLLRAMIIEHLAIFGYKIDKAENDRIHHGPEGIISAEGTPKMIVITTNEELAIAEDAAELIK